MIDVRRKESENDKRFKEIKADADNFGDALNEAGWAAIEFCNKYNIEVSAKLHNNLKAVLRQAILKYLDEVLKAENK